ncbi:Ribosomal protein L7 eukaryotic [Trinorchestia longiramus]|nr:Ribosomal protein L7 eukaryotic [Trinorchestia longiramus]
MPPAKVTLPTVPEVLLKQRKRRVQSSFKRNAVFHKKAALTRARQAEAFKRAERYAIYYRRKAKQEVHLNRLARAEGRVRVPGEPKLAFVVRTKGINCMPPKAKKILQLFRLRQINNGVFARINKPALNMLHRIEPYVTWGYPNLKSVRDLIYKRGFCRIKGKRVPLVNNEMIERRLGKFGIVCMEDLVHEIYTVGRFFTLANSFLSTFKLNNPAGGWRRKANHYVNGGDYGNRENQINKLLRKIV